MDHLTMTASQSLTLKDVTNTTIGDQTIGDNEWMGLLVLSGLAVSNIADPIRFCEAGSSEALAVREARKLATAAKEAWLANS
jgi:hypothetical protein